MAGGGARVGFIGLGAMGGGMAGALVKEGFSVCGYDIFEAAMKKLEDAGASAASTCSNTVTGASVLVVMVTTAKQAESVLFGEEGAVAALPEGSVVVLCSTVPPDFARTLEARIAALGRGLCFVDAPVSGGVARAANGTLTIMAAGTPEALDKARNVLEAMSEKLYIVGDQAGAGSAVKMVNQLLAGVHIAAAAEAMALGARAGLDTRVVYDIISHAAGNSWMFENRVPHMLDDDYAPRSALAIFVKDLGIVLGEAQGLAFPTPLAAAAHQQFLAGAAAGLGRQDDAAVVKVYEKLAGIRVACPAAPAAPGEPSAEPQRRPKGEVLGALPPEWGLAQGTGAQGGGAAGAVSALGAGAGGDGEKGSLEPLVVVLDDDPTGTQTVHGIDVLTQWDVASLEREMRREGVAAFFILTNSRALHTEEARALTAEICRNVQSAARAVGVLGPSPGVSSPAHRGLSIILRGDSTLRGHFPAEMEAAEEVLGPVDAWLLCPFFLEGGRYTVGDVHYVADGDELVPAGQTEFARDAAFGYKASDLKEWVQEKTGGRIPASQVASLPLSSIRQGGPAAVAEHLKRLPKGCVCIINAASNTDLAVVAAAVSEVEQGGKRFLCRTAASFVSARLRIAPLPPLGPSDFPPSPHGGLIVVGSYVPKTTKQVSVLLETLGPSLHVITVDAEAASRGLSEGEVASIAAEAEEALRRGQDTLVYTSRALVTASDASASLQLGQNISASLVAIVRSINVRPKYVLAKGGITSSDTATKGLLVERATVSGQAMAGVPLWSLGPSSRFPGLPYIVFPGNVGGPDAVASIVQRWQGAPALRPASASKTWSILQAAEKGGYAVGAFNVYSLEGVRAVVSAAEAERSPAILQIHPAAMKLGGAPLVTACTAAAAAAEVPVSLHLDHGTSEEQVMSALGQGFQSVMVDGSALPPDANAALTQRVVAAAHAVGVAVEAELGRIAGEEDGVTVADLEARMTSPEQADEFLRATGVDALAVCVGNRHGPYPPQQLLHKGRILDMPRLKALSQVASRHGAALVLHGASGLPTDVVQECIALGVRKFNVNTEVRAAAMEAWTAPEASGKDLADVLALAQSKMEAVVRRKMAEFGSAGKA